MTALKRECDQSDPLEKLLKVMQALRDPKTGCPWDIQQTYQSIIPYTIEEAYEVADAIEHGSDADLRHELGDLLFQVVFYAQIAAEEKKFDFYDVAESIAERMIARHPHVFESPGAEPAQWDDIKGSEAQGLERTLDRVAKGLPALMRAEKLQKAAARTGFEWPTARAAFDKLEEEIGEFKEAMEDGTDQDHIEEEFGDLMFCLVNYARMHGIDSEQAMRKANDKFYKRFSGLEGEVKAKNLEIKDCLLSDLIHIWKNQK